MTHAEYRALPGVNWSALKHLWSGSPAHYRYHLTAPDEDTAGRAAGRILHGLVLGGLDDEIVVYDGGDRRGKAWADFKAANVGKTIVKPDEIADVQAQASAVLAHPVARDLIRRADTEQTVTWADPDTGIPCKGRLDVLRASPGGYIADLKGCGGLALLDRQSARLGYLHQLAWYRRGVRVVHGLDLPAYIIGVETRPPHDVGVWLLDRDLLALCEREIVDTMRRLADCMARNVWPGRMPDLATMFIPSWMISDELEIPEAGLEDDDERL